MASLDGDQSKVQWQSEDPQYQRAPKHDGNSLETVFRWMKDHDKGTCNAWRDEIEKLLLVASLFSATVVSFVIDSYKWLQVANASASAVRINALWFVSLTTCLGTVILGILCLQWLREYLQELSLSNADAISIRQIRYEGLFNWKVPQLVSFLSIALQVSVFLFFGGILDLLWSLHFAVAAATTIAVGFVTAALVFTTFAPVVQSTRYFSEPVLNAAMTQSPYKSPFSWFFLCFAMFVGRHTPIFNGLIPPCFPWNFLNENIEKLTSWREVDVAWDIQQLHIREGKTFYNIRGLAKGFNWIIMTLMPARAQNESSSIVTEIFYSLLSGLPRPVAHKTLESWAAVIDNEDYKVALAQRLDGDGRSRVQYDLLMTWFLQRYSSMLTFDDFLLELCLRCMNTLRHVPEMNKMLDELLQDYKPTMASSDMEDASVCELHFQNIVTVLDYCSNPDLRIQKHHADIICQMVAEYIRCTTPVNTKRNASMCYEVHKRLARLVEATHNSMPYLTNAHINTATAIYKEPIVQETIIAASLFCGLDLCQVDEWEKQITRFNSAPQPTFILLYSCLSRLYLVLVAQAKDRMKTKLESSESGSVLQDAVLNQRLLYERNILVSLVTQIKHQLDSLASN